MSPSEDREERLARNAAHSAAEQGCQLLHLKILKLYEAVARRDADLGVVAVIVYHVVDERLAAAGRRREIGCHRARRAGQHPG